MIKAAGIVSSPRLLEANGFDDYTLSQAVYNDPYLRSWWWSLDNGTDYEVKRTTGSDFVIIAE